MTWSAVPPSAERSDVLLIGVDEKGNIRIVSLESVSEARQLWRDLGYMLHGVDYDAEELSEDELRERVDRLREPCGTCGHANHHHERDDDDPRGMCWVQDCSCERFLAGVEV